MEVPRALAIAALLLSISATGALAAPVKVCTLGVHGSEEIAAFESALPKEDCESVDLIPPLPSAQMGADFSADVPPGAQADDRGWLAGVCPSDLTCDVVVFSAELAGTFFGRLGGSLSLRQMEEASCKRRCRSDLLAFSRRRPEVRA